MRDSRPILYGSILFVFLCTGAARIADPESSPDMPEFGRPGSVRIRNLPSVFIENRGQWNRTARFATARAGMVICFEPGSIDVYPGTQKDGQRAPEPAMRLVFEGASGSARLEGLGPRSSSHHFFLGNEGSKWRTDVPGYDGVVYHDLYRGIDIRVREISGQLEYDLILEPGANLDQAVIHCEGVEEIEMSPDGSLRMNSEAIRIRQKPPQAWFELPSGGRRPVSCRFVRLDHRRYRFEVSELDPELTLVIDPAIEWSTFLGGTGDEEVMDLAVNPLGDIVIAGYTGSIDFPTTPAAYDTSYNEGAGDGYVACLRSDGSKILWSTYIGGVSMDVLAELTLDDQGWITAAGYTYSPNFPSTAGAYDERYNGLYDGVVVRLSPDGSELLYSTYLGSSWMDRITAIALRPSGEVVLGGYTGSDMFPVTSGAFDTTFNGGERDAFVACLDAHGTDLVFSTFLGGIGDEGHDQFYPIPETWDELDLELAPDGSGDIIVAGRTSSNDFPTTLGVYSEAHNGSFDAFVTRLNSAGTDLVFSTYLGGSWSDGAHCLEFDDGGNMILGGWTYSSNFPTTPTAYDTTKNSLGYYWDGFVASLSPDAGDLLYSTFLGGSRRDKVKDLAINDSGDVMLTGSCEADFPTTAGAYDDSYNGGHDGFISRMSLGGNGEGDLIYSTYLGTEGEDWCNSILLSGSETLLIGGYTTSEEFPTTPGAYDTTFNGSGDMGDGFICLFSPVAGVGDNAPDPSYPQTYFMAQNYPNPFNPSTTIAFDLPAGMGSTQKVSLVVYDIRGRRVKTLVDSEMKPGRHQVVWNGVDEWGRPVSSGLYLYTLKSFDWTYTRKMAISK